MPIIRRWINPASALVADAKPVRSVLYVAIALAALPLGAQQAPRWFATWAPSYFAAPAIPLPDQRRV
ncbi:MAG: hypothetical protein O2973_08615 [Gemmatimonadetes bacterium]|nr:hypothetical protein [Gemmatimonadota bacterium]